MRNKVDTEMLNHLERMADWVLASLNCRQWVWDQDQHDAAFKELTEAKAYIHHSKAKLSKPKSRQFLIADENR